MEELLMIFSLKKTHISCSCPAGIIVINEQTQVTLNAKKSNFNLRAQVNQLIVIIY